MTELTNAAEATQSLDAAPNEPVVNTEATQSEVKPEQVQADPQPVREKVKIKVDKEEYEVDPYSDEGLSYLRKGKAFDRIKEQNEKYAPVVNSLQEAAKDAGYSDVNQYLSGLKEQARLQKLQSLQDLDPEQLAQEAYRSRQLEEELNTVKGKYAEQERRDAEAERFHELFPDVKETDVPDEIWAGFAKGGSLIEGYRQHLLNLQSQEIAELKKQLSITKQNEANEASAVDSFIGKGGVQEKLYSMDEINDMSTEQIAKEWNLVQKSLKKIRGQ